MHPLYQDNVAHDYDFALLELDKVVPINKCIGVACLPRDSDRPGANCSITGWGTLVSSGPRPEILQEASVTLLTNEICEVNYTQAKNMITASMLCAAGRSRSGITDTCQGDSGGRGGAFKERDAHTDSNVVWVYYLYDHIHITSDLLVSCLS